MDKFVIKSNEESLENIYERINNLADLNEQDFIGTVSPTVVSTLESYIDLIYVYAKNPISAPLVASDGCGGIQVDWRKSVEKEFRFYIPDLNAEHKAKMYIYTIINGKPEIKWEPAPYEFEELFRTIILS